MTSAEIRAKYLKFLGREGIRLCHLAHSCQKTTQLHFLLEVVCNRWCHICWAKSIRTERESPIRKNVSGQLTLKKWGTTATLPSLKCLAIGLWEIISKRSKLNGCLNF